MNKYAVGDSVIIVKDTSSHFFAIGTIVKIKCLPFPSHNMYFCYGKNPIRYGDDRKITRYVRKTDIVPVTDMTKALYED